MSKIITVMIRKGGSGKTSTAQNLASGLAKHGKRVLLVDLDSQANSGTGLGVVDEYKSLPNVLGGKIDLSEAIHQVGDFYLLPSSDELADYENALMAKANIYAIKNLLSEIRDEFDFIVIDTPPSGGVITRNALVASDYALIPVQAQTYAVKGLVDALDLVRNIKETANPKLELAGILPNMVQSQTNVSKLFLKHLQSEYDGKVLPFSIPLTVEITASQLVGKPLVETNPDHKASQAFLKLADYIIELSEEQTK